MKRRLLAFLSVCLAGVAQSTEPDRLRLGPLLEDVLRHNPEIRAAQKHYEALRQRPDQVSGLPDPMLSVGYTSSGSPLPLAGLGLHPTSNAGFMLSQALPFPGKRKLRGDIAHIEAQAAFLDYRAVQIQVLSRLKQAYHRLHSAYEILDVIERNRQLIRKLLRVAELRYASGQASQQDLLKAHTQLTILDTRLERVEQERRSAEAELNTVLARRPDFPVGRPASLAPATLRPSLEELMLWARSNSPLLQRQERMLRRAELALNEARKDVYPDATLSAGYFTMGAMPDMYQFRLDINLPAYYWRKQRAAVAEQAHNLSQSRRAFEALEQEVQFRIKDNYLMAHTSERLMRMYADLILPQAGFALEASLASYETGAVDFLTVLSNFQTILEYEENYHREVLNFHLALVRLEELTGVEFIDWVP